MTAETEKSKRRRRFVFRKKISPQAACYLKQVEQILIQFKAVTTPLSTEEIAELGLEIHYGLCCTVLEKVYWAKKRWSKLMPSSQQLICCILYSGVAHNADTDLTRLRKLSEKELVKYVKRVFDRRFGVGTVRAAKKFIRSLDDETFQHLDKIIQEEI